MPVYLLKANIALALFYLAYRWGLRRLTFYTLNRCFLLAGIACSALLPLLNINAFVERHQPLNTVVATYYTYVPDLEALRPEPAGTVLPAWLVYAFWAGVAVMGLRLLLQLLSLWRMHCSATAGMVGTQPVKIVQAEVSPFSFMRNIYLNTALHTPEELQAVVSHEQVHVRQWHTADVLLGELNKVFYWFNPGAWLMSTAIRENLEFITDRYMLRQGMDRKIYQYSLIKVSGIPYATAIANNFNFSHLKKRIMMMNKKRSSRYHLLRYLVVGSMVGGALLSLNFRPGGIGHLLANDTLPGVIMSPASDKQQSGKIKMSWLGVSEEAFKKGVRPLYVVDGAEMDLDAYNTYRKAHQEESHFRVKVVKAADAVPVYGSKAVDGAFIIESRKGGSILPPPPPPRLTLQKSRPGTGSFRGAPAQPGSRSTTISGQAPANARKPGPAAITVEGKPAPSPAPSAIDIVPAPEPAPAPGDALNNGDGQQAPVLRLHRTENVPLFVLDDRIVGRTQPPVAQDQIASVDVLKDASAIREYGEEGRNGVIKIYTKGYASEKGTTFRADTVKLGQDPFKPKPSMYLLNGKEISEADVQQLLNGKGSVIKSMTVLKGGSAKAIYGEKAKDGVILLETK